MPDYSKEFDSPFVKAGANTKQGDHLRFLDAGEKRQNKKELDKVDIVFNVAIVRNGKVTAQKLFSLNKTNFKAVSKVYGSNSDDWIDKEMMVNIVKRQNPQGEVVDAIALSAPGALGEVENDFLEE